MFLEVRTYSISPGERVQTVRLTTASGEWSWCHSGLYLWVLLKSWFRERLFGFKDRNPSMEHIGTSLPGIHRSIDPKLRFMPTSHPQKQVAKRLLGPLRANCTTLTTTRTACTVQKSWWKHTSRTDSNCSLASDFWLRWQQLSNLSTWNTAWSRDYRTSWQIR